MNTQFYTPKANITLHRYCDECGSRHEEEYTPEDVFDVDRNTFLATHLELSVNNVGRVEDGQIVRHSPSHEYYWDDDKHDFKTHFERCELPVRHGTISMSDWWSDEKWRKLRTYERAVKQYEVELIRLRKLVEEHDKPNKQEQGEAE